MKSDDSVPPIVLICFIIMVLAALCGAIVEGIIGKGNLLWVMAGSPALLAGAIIGIHMIVTRRAFYGNREYVGKSAVFVGSLVLTVFGSAFICLITSVLSGSP